MAKKKKIEGLGINNEYIIMPVGNGFILRPNNQIGEFKGFEVTCETFVFNTSTDLADFIDVNFVDKKGNR